MSEGKKGKVLKIITVVCAVAGFVVAVLSVAQKDELAERRLVYLALSLFGLAFLVGIVGGILNSKRIFRDIKEEKDRQREIYDKDKSAWEEESIEFINDSAYGEEHKKRIAVRWLFHLFDAKKNIKYFSKKSRILGGIMITVCLLLAVSMVPLFAFGKTVAGLIVLGSFFAILITSAIANSIIEKRSMSRSKKYMREIAKDKHTDWEEKSAKVLACFLSSESSFSSGGSANPYYTQRTKILSTTYRVIVDVDGEEKTAFSKKFYNEGEIVKVITKPNSNSVSILQSDNSQRVNITQVDERHATIISGLQKLSFAELLEKYEDYDTSPASESIDKVKSRFEDPYTYHYLIKSDFKTVGMLRVVDNKKADNKRLAQICILPKYRHNGYATEAIKMAEAIHGATGWELDTILQEKSLCSFYEKLGYKQTDRVSVINDKMTLVVYEK